MEFENLDEEIKEIEDKLREIEIMSSYFSKKIDKETSEIMSKVAIKSANNLNVLKYIEQCIVKLQMTVFADSITRIQVDSKGNNRLFYITFDENEGFEDIVLTATEYNDFKSFKVDNSFTSLYDKLKEKDTIYHYQISSNLKISTSTNIKANTVASHSKPVIADMFYNNINLCHNCKLRKPSHYMYRCNSDFVNKLYREFEILDLKLYKTSNINTNFS